MLIVSSPEPWSSICRVSFARSFQGLSSGTLNDCESDSIMRKVQPPPRSMACDQGSTAPWRMLFDGSGMTRSGSISGREPSPLHSWHMPSGLLQEKLCGACETALARVLEDLAVLPLAVLDERGEQGQLRALGELGELVRDLLRALLAHPPPADGAVLLADGREEHAQVVVDLGDGPDGGA